MKKNLTTAVAPEMCYPGPIIKTMHDGSRLTTCRDDGTKVVPPAYGLPGRRFFMSVLVLFLAAAPLQAESVKVYGVQTEADLTSISAVTPTFQFQLCDIRTGQCDPANTGTINWTRIQDDGQGQVKLLTDGTMNATGWMYADKYIKIFSVAANTPGWALTIHTDNVHTTPTYRGPLVSSGVPISETTINGLVSSDGQILLPLNWKLAASPTTFNVRLSTPMPVEVPAGGVCNGIVRSSAGFCDSATHYMGDKSDLLWWQNPALNASRREEMKNYQSLLRPDGAATGDFYRSPYSTLTGIPPYYLYVGGKFFPSLRYLFSGSLILEIVSQ